MTRFARAKGSKASNERLPEAPTSWREMKHELLNKNKELEDKKNREKAMRQRQDNYRAFLKERVEEEDKNVSWADFPKVQTVGELQKTDHASENTAKKRKFISEIDEKKESKSRSNNKKNKKNVQQHDVESENSDEEFSALKLEVEKVLSKQMADNSDSDGPPEEISAKEKPQEIIVKKSKKSKQKLQILINQKNKSDVEKEIKQEKKGTKINLKNENLSDKDKKKIEKKQKRYKKQLEKKKLKVQAYEMAKIETLDDNGVNNTVIKKNSTDHDSSEINAEKLKKKLERRKKQKEKKLKHMQEAGLVPDEGKSFKQIDLTEEDLKKIQKKKERRARQAEKRKKIREAKALAAENVNKDETGKVEQIMSVNDELNKSKDNINRKIDRHTQFQDNFSKSVTNIDQKQSPTERKPYQNHLNNQKKKKEKLKDDKNVQRRKGKTETMFINGKTIEIDYVDGFPVKKEDAERLKKLRKEMISKGLPRSEINVALKLERRRAEKALAREKKNVCFNCRKSGHNLSECPELDKDQVAQTAGTGICFKCGSTEHTHFDCKVVKGQEYKFATCFICKEQGHISRQCPDNQRGLYPKGGACKVCGDVTHLKKDCPKYQAQQAQLQAHIDVGTLDSRNPEDLGSQGDSNNSRPMKKLSKKIKF